MTLFFGICFFLRQERRETERQLLKEQLMYGKRVTEKRIEMKSKSTQAKLPNTTPAESIRFENMFTAQVNEKPTCDEE